jgi:hypothetical protein
VLEDNEILGVIYLKDVIKDGLVERFRELREMGIETVMYTLPQSDPHPLLSLLSQLSIRCLLYTSPFQSPSHVNQCD